MYRMLGAIKLAISLFPPNSKYSSWILSWDLEKQQLEEDIQALEQNFPVQFEENDACMFVDCHSQYGQVCQSVARESYFNGSHEQYAKFGTSSFVNWLFVGLDRN